jgi:D-serine deaminase-like pyridoxal phosphate-dependent protein
MSKSLIPSNLPFRIDNPDEVNSPALLIYPERVKNNIAKMLSVAGDSSMLRPHVKTHKMPEIVRMQLKHGINKFKCATIAEAEMVAGCGGKDILLAYQPVGPNIIRFFELQKKFRHIKISCIADCENIIMELSGAAITNNIKTSVWLDINNGMNRTGINPGYSAATLFKMIADSPMLVAEGLHVYDGHIHDADYMIREKACNDAFSSVSSFISELAGTVGRPIGVIAGGTPTFPVHAKRKGVETSPGTAVLWDYGYSSLFRDMDFLHSAVLLTRVISKPAADLVCIDLGTKAVASEMPHPRIKIMEIPGYEFVSHNEEHMVIMTPDAKNMSIGDLLYCIPYHICPTVDRYDKVSVVRNGKVTEHWNVEARKREITI